MTDQPTEHRTIALEMQVTRYDVSYARREITVLGGNAEAGVHTDGIISLRVEGAEYEGAPVSDVFLFLLGPHQPRESVGEISQFPDTPPFSGAWLWLPLADLPHVLATLAAERPTTAKIFYDSVPTSPSPFPSNRLTFFELQSRLTTETADRVERFRETAHRRR